MDELPKRKPNRCESFDYSSAGAYFVTICTKDKRKILSEIAVGDGVLDVPLVRLTEYGKIAEEQIKTMNNIYDHLSVDVYVIMPNHIHMIITIHENRDGTPRTSSPTASVLSQFVSTFKRFCNAKYGCNIFQRSFHDHIIRNEKDYTDIWAYIETNPAKWAEDRYYQK